LLEWLGDLGGLYDALKVICGFLVAPFAAFQLNTEMLHRLFRFIPS